MATRAQTRAKVLANQTLREKDRLIDSLRLVIATAASDQDEERQALVEAERIIVRLPATNETTEWQTRNALAIERAKSRA